MTSNSQKNENELLTKIRPQNLQDLNSLSFINSDTTIYNIKYQSIPLILLDLNIQISAFNYFIQIEPFKIDNFG